MSRDSAAEAPVAIVGAGAAGIVAAIFAARAGARVLLLESTRDGGRKILVSGGGRCNVLPTALEPARFVTASSPNSLRKLLTGWPLAEQRAFFERDVGLELAVEAETGKIFPTSNRAREVRDRLFALAQRGGVEVRFGARLVDLEPSGVAGGWTLRLADRTLGPVEASAVVLATGGLSMPGTGSDGGGLKLVRALGHTVHETYPALTPLIADPPLHAELAGISRAVRLEAPAPPRATVTQGGFLFTHRGYSGPAVLDISHRAVLSRLAGGERQKILVRWTELDADAWERELLGRTGSVAAPLRHRLPDRLVDLLLRETGIEPSQSLAQLRREVRRGLIDRLTRYPLPWTGDEGYAKAEVTGGGVALGEVHPRTLESRRHPGLFLCGEMLDAFGPIGGHNFAWAWSTGRAAGLGAAGLGTGGGRS